MGNQTEKLDMNWKNAIDTPIANLNLTFTQVLIIGKSAKIKKFKMIKMHYSAYKRKPYLHSVCMQIGVECVLGTK